VEWRYSATIFDLETTLRSVVSFTARQLFSQGNSPRYLWDTNVGGHLSLSECYREESNLAPAENRTPAVQPVAIQAELSYIINIDSRQM
jgi:hypothetical protein